MYTNENMRYRKLIARTIVKLAYQPENSEFYLSKIHRRYIHQLLGVDYDTFLDYLNEEKDDLSDLELRPDLVLTLWYMVNLEPFSGRFPPELERKLAKTPIPRRVRVPVEG